MSTSQAPLPVGAPRDQSVGLTLFGIFQILIGCLFLMMVPLILISATVSVPRQVQGQAMDVRMMMPAVFVYLMFAVVFIVLGIGSIRARRWAWALTVLLSWLWLVVGITGIVFVALTAPHTWASLVQQTTTGPQASAQQAQVMLIVQVFTFGIMGCAYLLLPAVFLLFYQRKSVRATCERRDPQPRWTDRCPLPVLALSVMLGFCVLCLPASALFLPFVAFFGVVLRGAPAVIAIVLLAVLLAFLARGTYRLQMWAWWGTVLLSAVGVASMAVTFWRLGLIQMYEQMGLPPNQLEMFRKMGLDDTTSPFCWFTLATWAAMFGYLVYVRRYFSGKTS